jgi:hypothetical protein
MGMSDVARHIPLLVVVDNPHAASILSDVS